MAGCWRARESEGLGETSAVGGTHFPALGILGVQNWGVCPENNGMPFKVLRYCLFLKSGWTPGMLMNFP